MDKVPHQKGNKVQSDVKRAVDIACYFNPAIKRMRLMCNMRNPTSQDFAIWRAAADEVEAKVLACIQENKPAKPRERENSGAIQGVIRTWNRLKLDSLFV